MQYLTFFLHGVEYAVSVNIVETVVEQCDTMAVPTPVEYMKGVMNLRGQVIPVIDLRKKFGLPQSEDAEGACVIVFSIEDGDKRRSALGALVDKVSEVITIDENSIEYSSAEGVALWERYVRGIVRLKSEHMVVIIEDEALFSTRELKELQAV
jgi:purine-binding chemotaxis protein CheW